MNSSDEKPAPTRASAAARTDAAIKRLQSALDFLEAALERHAGTAGASDNLREELAVMQDDRARLAAELDGALHRNHTLGLASDDVEVRLQRASTTIKTILDQNSKD